MNPRIRVFKNRFGIGMVEQGQQQVNNMAARLMEALTVPANMVHHLDAMVHDKAAMLYVETGSIVSYAEPKVDTFGPLLKARMDAIVDLPIDRLNEREGMLVDLLVLLVDRETEQGKLTAKEGNAALERMPWWNSLDIYVKDCGFNRLGNGHFSVAYSHPMLPGKVIKVGFKKEDSGAAYVAFCRMHQGRAGIPTIYSVARHQSCYTVVLDQLASGRDIRDSVAGRDAYSAVSEAVETGTAPGYLDDDSGLNEYNRELVETGFMIHKFFKGIARFDMHTGNIMLDEQNRIVITDPVSFSNDDREFSVDPDALIAEVEAIAKVAMINRCRIRKAKRNMIHIEACKVEAKARKAKWKARNLEKAADERHCARLNALWVPHERVQELAGTVAWDRIHWRNRQGDLINIKNHLVAKEHYGIQKALVAGRALPMDARLDAQFFRG